MRKTLALTLLALMVAAANAFAVGEGRMQGHVIDAVTKEDLSDVEVRCNERGWSRRKTRWKSVPSSARPPCGPMTSTWLGSPPVSGLPMIAASRRAFLDLTQMSTLPPAGTPRERRTVAIDVLREPEPAGTGPDAIGLPPLEGATVTVRSARRGAANSASWSASNPPSTCTSRSQAT